MTYEAPYIDAAGLHIPTYTDIRDNIISQMQSIFGSDIYLDDDSQDYQMLSVFALMLYDTLQGLLLSYNSSSTTYATGSALDRLVTLNGITRTAATYSTCQVTITGTPGTKITSGVVQDAKGYYWDLNDKSVTIGDDGTISVGVTCRTVGKATAEIGDLNIIATPTRGWTAVTNAVAASPGNEEETDIALRKRQRLAVASPSRTVFEGTLAAVAAVPDVKRYQGYENDTSETVDGLPPHSITVVAEGGDTEAIANAIFEHKTPGCYSNGTTEIEVEDAKKNKNTIRFYYIDPDTTEGYTTLTITVEIGKLAGYVDETADEIKDNIEAYIADIGIGETLYVSNLNKPVLEAISGTPTFYVKSITVAEATDGKVEAGKTGCLAINKVTVTAS